MELKCEKKTKGINVTIVGHPFDTLKVRLQTQVRSNKSHSFSNHHFSFEFNKKPIDKPIYDGLIDCFKKTIQWEGIGGLYKGVASPLIGQIFFRILLFTSHGQAKRTLSQDGLRQLTVPDFFLAGSFAWSVAVLAECPIDLYKSQMQVQIIKSKSDPNYIQPFKNMQDCVVQSIKSNGIRGPYQGFVPHLLRNACGGFLHLGFFDVIRTKLAKDQGIPVGKLSIFQTMVAGGIGGVTFWTLVFPRNFVSNFERNDFGMNLRNEKKKKKNGKCAVDVVKSSIQADNIFKDQRKYKGTLDAISKLYAEGGLKRFYRGFSPCLLRAFPANAVLVNKLFVVNFYFIYAQLYYRSEKIISIVEIVKMSF